MNGTASQAYLNTRVSVMATRLFPPALTESLAQRSPAELAERFGLAALGDTQVPARARGRAIEQSLIQMLLAELGILIRPMTAAERDLLLDWGRKYALYNLKALIRGKLHNLEQKEIHENLYELPARIRLPDLDLFRAENVQELLRRLDASPYRAIARQAREIYERQREPFALEAAIDQRHYAGLARRVQGFEAHAAGSLRRLIGAELDRTSLLWLLRFRFTYRLSPSETFYQLVPSVGLLGRDRLLRLVNLDSLPELIEALPAPLDRLLAGSDTLVEVQRRMGGHVAREAERTLRRDDTAVARALAYLMLREMDLLLLFAVIQGRLLELPEPAVATALDLSRPRIQRPGALAA